jgi:hypothetical protein
VIPKLEERVIGCALRVLRVTSIAERSQRVSVLRAAVLLDGLDSRSDLPSVVATLDFLTDALATSSSCS